MAPEKPAVVPSGGRTIPEARLRLLEEYTVANARSLSDAGIRVLHPNSRFHVDAYIKTSIANTLKATPVVGGDLLIRMPPFVISYLTELLQPSETLEPWLYGNRFSAEMAPPPTAVVDPAIHPPPSPSLDPHAREFVPIQEKLVDEAVPSNWAEAVDKAEASGKVAQPVAVKPKQVRIAETTCVSPSVTRPCKTPRVTEAEQAAPMDTRSSADTAQKPQTRSTRQQAKQKEKAGPPPPQVPRVENLRVANEIRDLVDSDAGARLFKEAQRNSGLTGMDDGRAHLHKKKCRACKWCADRLSDRTDGKGKRILMSTSEQRMVIREYHLYLASGSVSSFDTWLSDHQSRSGSPVGDDGAMSDASDL